jgi:AraC family transcriptional regulator of adaptative response / DNA-3-methyladenine glycosylase II
LRIPGCWDGFELAVRAILGQQVTVAGASTLSGRLVRAFGTPVVVSKDLTHIFPAPEKLAESDITKIGLPKARAECIRLLARAVRDRNIAFSGAVNAEEFLSQFSGLPGIGPWTAQYVLMRALGEPDAFPSGDLGLLRALGLRNPRELESRAQRWRPWRAYAAMYLWQGTLKNEQHLFHPDRKSNRAVAAGGR